MKTLYRDNKGLHRWLFACGAVLVLFYLFRGNRAAVNFWVYSVTLPFEQFLGRACAALPFSVAELLYVLAAVTAVVLLVLLVVLGVTSFAFVKRQMSTASGKKGQKLAYPFFGLVDVHLLLMLLPSALHGGLAAQASVAVYSVVFVGYALCRVGRALADKRAEDAVSASNDLTPAISDEPEMVS